MELKQTIGSQRACRLAAVILGVSAVLAGAPAAAAPHAAPVATNTDALRRLASSMEQDHEYARADFAAIAIEEVIAVYEFEFQRLSERRLVSEREAVRQSRWAAALRTFIDELYAARDALDTGAPVQILVSPPASVQILVGARSVSLESPRIEQARLLDDAIVTGYCYHFGCDLQFLEGLAEAPATTRRVNGGWSFGAGIGSTYETIDGLGFMFSDVEARALKEQACRQVREELLRLAAALAAELRAGHHVDFDGLRLESASLGRAEQLVVVTPVGPRVSMSLPALARAPGVVEIARDWLRAQAQGEGYRQLFPRADLLLAGLLPPS